PALGDEADLALFRALQEALANVARHAGASAAEVTVTVESGASGGAVQLVVADNGRGFGVDEEGRVDEGAGRMGLTGMRERIHAAGGAVRLRNAPGAEVRITVPVPAPAVAAPAVAAPVVAAPAVAVAAVAGTAGGA
ncbi:MAG: ATP-binding protein, partial [Gemmatimonadetes bacterium]|nr:ATP-binding protein [Gemmatimonadota bacterium]